MLMVSWNACFTTVGNTVLSIHKENQGNHEVFRIVSEKYEVAPGQFWIPIALAFSA